MKKRKPFEILHCIKYGKNWIYWNSRGNKCPHCNEDVGIIWSI